MVSGLLSAELAATCNAIGYYDGQKYHLEPHSKETIKDIIRYLRRDEKTHDIRRFLGNSKILNTDLLPILQCHSKDKELFDLVLRLIVNLSTPALIVYEEVVPTEKSDLNQYLQIVGHLQNYKEAFGDHKAWSVLTEQLSLLLNKDIENRDDDDQRTIERILILIRNILYVPSDAIAEGRPDNDASIHDQVIWALHQSSMLDLLLYMASSYQEAGFFLHLLEIISLLVREQPPALLAQTAAQRSADEKHRDEEELLKLRQKEQQVRQNKTRQYLGSRHSNFGGTYVIKNMKSTTDKDLIYHKPLHKVDNFSLDIEKKKVKIPKNRMPLKCGNVERRSALSVRLIMKQFCVEILNAAYNPLMRHIKDIISRGKSQDNDESYYFTAMKFFMEFNRNYKFQVKLVSETMSVETFHFVQKYLETWHEMMVTDKKKIALWSARMHLALKAYKELLQNLAAMDTSPDATVRESSKVIKSNIFYVVEYREMLLTLINTYKKSKYSHQYLIDLIETTHIFLKLIEKFCKNKPLIVQKQVRKQKRTKSKKKKQAEEKTLAAEELWPQISPRLENVLDSTITKEVIPFDASSDKSIDDQKIDAMKRIQMFLKSGDIEESVALLRASREVWPENDYFGNSSMSKEEEMECLKEVFLADLDLSGIPQKDKENNFDAEVQDDSEDEEEEDIYPKLSEQTINLMDLIKRFASPRVMGVCITLLSTYERNSAFTNHCVAKMLHRIAWDCKLPSMLFQASLFRKFQTILESKDPRYKELAGLAVFTMRKFAEIAQTNKKLLLEILFFKNPHDAYEIECGYGSMDKSSKSSIQNWEDHEEDELRRLYSEYMQIMPSEEMVDWITDQLISERPKRIVKKKMNELGLTILTKNKKGLITSWTEEQEEELRDLYFELKDSSEDVIIKIMEKLNVTRGRQNIAKALVKLGFAVSTKEFLNKTSKSGKGKKKGLDDSSRSGSESSEEEDEPVPVETREEIRAKEKVPDLYHTTEQMFSEKETKTYLTEGLNWLSSSMNDCLEDIDDDPAEVPLLPLSNESMLSIENEEFKHFLSSLGIFRPLQQEIYWRFPADWKEVNFKSRDKLVKLIIDNQSIDDCREEINSLIKEITGKDPETQHSDTSEDESSMLPRDHEITRLSKEIKKEKKSPKRKLKDLKMKLLGRGNGSEIDSKKTTSKPRKKADKTTSLIKKFSLENIDDANTEEFNAFVTEQCREVLQEGRAIVSCHDSSINKSRNESDSESENSRQRHLSRKKSRVLVGSDSEDETSSSNLLSTMSPLKSRFPRDEDEDMETDIKITSKKLSSRKARLDSDSDDENSRSDMQDSSSPLKSKISRKARLDDSDDENPKSDLENSSLPLKNKTSRKARLDDSDDENPNSDLQDSSLPLKNKTPKKSSSRKARLDSDSDDETLKSDLQESLSPLKSKTTKNNDAGIKTLSKKPRLEDSDSDAEKSSEKLQHHPLTLKNTTATNDEVMETDHKPASKRSSKITRLEDSDSEEEHSNNKTNRVLSPSVDRFGSDIGKENNANLAQVPVSKRLRLTDSESDEEVMTVKKKKHIIESDDE